MLRSIKYYTLLMIFILIYSIRLISQTEWIEVTNKPVLDYGNSGKWDVSAVCRPSVVKDGDTLRMWCTGYNDHHIYDKIGYATSRNGLEWQKLPANPVIASNPTWGNGHASDTVLKFDGYYHMWYTSYLFTHGMGNYQAKIGYMTSQSLVDIEPSKNALNIPRQYQLFQNFPNPFNLTTKIRFSIAEACRIQIDIYNFIG